MISANKDGVFPIDNVFYNHPKNAISYSLNIHIGNKTAKFPTHYLFITKVAVYPNLGNIFLKYNSLFITSYVYYGCKESSYVGGRANMCRKASVINQISLTYKHEQLNEQCNEFKLLKLSITN